MQVERKASNPAARFAKELLSTVLKTVAFGLLWCVNIGLQLMFLLTNCFKIFAIVASISFTTVTLPYHYICNFFF